MDMSRRIAEMLTSWDLCLLGLVHDLRNTFAFLWLVIHGFDALLDVSALGLVTLCTLSFLLRYIAGLGICVFGLAFIVVYIPIVPCWLTRESAPFCLVLRSSLYIPSTLVFALAFLRAHVLWLRVVPLGLFLFMGVVIIADFVRPWRTILSLPFLAGFALLWRSCSALYVYTLLLFHQVA